ncbi:IclR family transcriptional regulator [Jatrophihabitans telluris]|uniref:IclR family transcriptional regulator n=1 Tax=Jatrophihabitans telluris TaxID=2038343 RepID=A0ABY4QVB2_9ACTN|nr:IclR family transcriptional regulator [Jatrophihabitans telluris]UQX86976.1 IclR family transcriptional regulator [Jatrophihabitans telluris]
MVNPPSSPTAERAGVQSLHRALDVIEAVEQRGGHLPIAEIAAAAGLPLPTTHRLLHTLVERGWMRQLPNRRYALGFRLTPLGASAARLAATGATPLLADLVSSTGESANVAVLSGDRAEYVAQVPSAHSMRTFTEVGRRVELHCTGVGKAMLAQLSDTELTALVRRGGLAGYTDHTLTTERDLLDDLAHTRSRGYALDEQEQELGVRCVAVVVPDSGPAWTALSVSGPVTRMTDALIADAVPRLHAAGRKLRAATIHDGEAHS